jgi:hypothetical protein
LWRWKKKYTTTNIWKLEIFPIPKLNKNYHHKWRIFKPGVGIKFYIILNIGFRVCKWTGMPEKRVLSFAFYMGDAQPKHAEKGVEKGMGTQRTLSQGRVRRILPTCYIFKPNNKLY